MSTRLFAISVVAIGLPLGSFLALKLDLLPAPWLGVPDAALTAGIIMGLLASGRPLRRWMIGIAVTAAAVVAFALRPETSALAYPILLNGFLAYYFHRSLAGDREPVISRIARIERGHLPEELVLYTRRLTLAWGLFFLATTAELSALARHASIETYMLFANTLNLILVAAFFAIEYGYRRIRFRHYAHPPLLHFARQLLDGGWLVDATPEPRRETRSGR